ncbi:MAG: phage tail protein [Bacteroidota bacterium]
MIDSSIAPFRSETSYPLSFYFSLSFKGEDAAFQEVSGISKQSGIEEVASGGENRFTYRLPVIFTSQNLVLKRAVLPKDSSLLEWCAACMDEGLNSPIVPHDVPVSLLNEEGQVNVKWTFYKAYPVKYAVSDLKSTDNSVVVETLELAYTYFEASA